MLKRTVLGERPPTENGAWKKAGGFHQWLADTRIADAQAMLRSGEASSLIDAAYAVGFTPNGPSTTPSAAQPV